MLALLRSGLSELYLYSSQYLSQYPRGSHAFRATVIIDLADVSSLDSPRYPEPSLVAREAYGRLPLFDYLFFAFLYGVLGSSLSVP